MGLKLYILWAIASQLLYKHKGISLDTAAWCNEGQVCYIKSVSEPHMNLTLVM